MVPLNVRGVRTLASTVLCLTTMACASTGGLTTVSGASSPPAGWAPVRALAIGATIDVEYERSISAGLFEAADADRLRMLVDGSPVEIPRASIRRIVQRTHARRISALRGLLVGAAAGAVWGAVSTETNRLPWSIMLSAGWGGFGAGIGALAAPERQLVIYRSADAP
jgi:hypothetical protein